MSKLFPFTCFRDVNVTYAARKASVAWPEKAFCDTTNSYFDCSMLNHLQTRKLGRMVKNDAVILLGGARIAFA